MFGRCLWVAVLCSGAGFAEVPGQIDFKRDVQPVFREHCVSCHGPTQQMANFRLDRRRDAMRGGTIAVIAPGTSSGSRLYHKITSTKYGTRMPPTGPLSAENIEILKRWLDQGAVWPDDAAGDAPQRPPDPSAVRLMEAIRSSDDAAVRKMLSADAGIVNRQGPGGTTPLMYAVLYSTADQVKALLEAGAGVNARNDGGATALMWAVSDIGKTRLLLDAGAEVNVHSSENRTPLSIAAARHGSAPVVKLLLERGAKLTGAGRSPVNDAAQGDEESLAALLEIEKKGSGLSAAVRSHCAGCVDRLLQVAKPDDLSSALNTAASMGDAGLFRRFSALDAPLPKPNADGITILMRASAHESASPEIVQSLVRRGMDVNAKANAGESALDYAHRNGNAAVVAVLKEAGGRQNVRPENLERKAKPAASIEAALDRSLPLLKKVDEVFLRQSGCVSCHNNSLFAMLLPLAKRGDRWADEASAERQRKAIGPYIESWRERAMQGIGIPGGPDTVSYILVGLAGVNYAPDAATDALAYYLLGRQHADGSWKIQNHRPPIEASDIEVTATSLRALQAYAPQTRKTDYERAVRRAADWLESAPARTTEDRAFQLLGLAWAGGKTKIMAKAASALLEEQRPDGGWAQLATLSSDAYATGQAMVALRQSGVVSASSPPYRKAVRFLLNTQFADGSWFVRSRAIAFQPYFETGFPYGNDQWISTAATNWAAMGLLLALP